MITITSIDDMDIKTEGAVEVGDLYPDYCCKGFNIQVLEVDEFSVWYHCQNPDCPQYGEDVGPSDPYRGIDNTQEDDLVEFLAEQKYEA